LYNTIVHLNKPVPKTAAAVAPTDTREQILEAALVAFAEDGFDGATTRDIAARAGVALGLLRYHFGSKTELWKAAVDRAFAELGASLAGALGDPSITDDEERIRRMLRDHVRFVARNPAWVRMMHEEGKRRGPRMRWLVDRHVKPLYEAMAGPLAAAKRRGTIPADVGLVHFFYILAGAVGLIFHQAEECKRLAGVDPADGPVVEAHVRAVEHLLLGPPHKEDAR
jgi:AcrR family transcriptional regulator